MILSTKDTGVSEADLRAVATPQATRTWYPLPHHRLLDQVRHALSHSGWQVTEQIHHLTNEGKRYFGLMRLESPSFTPEDYALVVGLRNSHDRSIVAGLAAGASVMCCDNLSFSSTVVIERKHTRFIERDLPRMTADAVGRLGDMSLSQDNRFKAYKATELSDAEVHDLLIRCMEADILPATTLPVALREWQRPSHEEFAVARSGWRLFNAATEALKGRSIDALPRRTHALHGLLDQRCGVLDVLRN